MRFFFLFLALISLPLGAETAPAAEKAAPSAQRATPKAASKTPLAKPGAKTAGLKGDEKPKHRKGFVPIPKDLKNSTASQGKKSQTPFKRAMAPAKNDEVFLEAPVTPAQADSETPPLSGAPDPIGTLTAGV